jgi:hypothetical protein
LVEMISIAGAPLRKRKGARATPSSSVRLPRRRRGETTDVKTPVDRSSTAEMI